MFVSRSVIFADFSARIDSFDSVTVVRIAFGSLEQGDVPSCA